MSRLDGLVIEGPLTLKSVGENVQPRGWERVTMAWRCLRGKPIVFATPIRIENCTFHEGARFTGAPHE
jgi:hypothetical protein